MTAWNVVYQNLDRLLGARWSERVGAWRLLVDGREALVLEPPPWREPDLLVDGQPPEPLTAYLARRDGLTREALLKAFVKEYADLQHGGFRPTTRGYRSALAGGL